MRKRILKLTGLLFAMTVMTVFSAFFTNQRNNASVLDSTFDLNSIPADVSVGTLDALESTSVVFDEAFAVHVDTSESELNDITSELNEMPILESDILRRWYYSSEEAKKYGTPERWIFMEAGAESVWISPDALDAFEYADTISLCDSTGGTFVYSCKDSAQVSCQHIDQSACQCTQGSVWKEYQGCIDQNDRGSFVVVTATDLDSQFYYALKNNKKLNTPEEWIWSENAENSEKSAWHDPNYSLH